MIYEKDKWIRYIHDEIYEASDKIFQKDVWVKNIIKNVASSYDELRNRLMYDFYFDEFIGSFKELGLSESLHHKLIKFRDEFNSFESKKGRTLKDSEIIDDSDWNNVTSLAKEALTLLRTEYPYLGNKGKVYVLD